MPGPKPPDPHETAAAQTETNRDTAVTQYGLGATNQITPGGSLTYEQIGTWPDGTPRYQATTSLSPENEALRSQLMSGYSSAAGQAGMPLPDYGAYRTQTENAIQSRWQPQLDAARSGREADLFNRGVRPGTAAYDRAMGLLGQQENDLRLQTTLAGGQEASRMWNDMLAGRAAPINELNAIMGGSQINVPGFANTPQPGVGGVDYAGLVNNDYQARLSQHQNMMSGLFGLGTALIGLSDRRLKSNIVRVGTHPLLNIGIYDYDLLGTRTRGVMAQELQEVMPEAVHEGPDGYLRVNYGMI